MLSNDWQRCRSTAVKAFRYLEDQQVLQLLFVDGRRAYDYPCPPDIFERFLAAPSKGHFHNEVLKPHAEAQGWSPRPSDWPRNEPIDL